MLTPVQGHMTQEARHLLLDILFHGVAAPSALWVGIAKAPDNMNDLNLATLTQNEPSRGYHRVEVQKSDWRFTDALTIHAADIVFVNQSENPWPMVNLAFIATRPDDSGILLWWDYLKAPQLIFPRGRLLMPTTLRMD